MIRPRTTSSSARVGLAASSIRTNLLPEGKPVGNLVESVPSNP